MTRESRVTTVMSCGGSPSNSAVARWTASSVRIGSTGNGRHARASTASVTATTSQRRRNPCSQRSPARSSAGVKRPATRAPTRAREASVNVRADVMRRRRPRNTLRATASCSRSAASKALVSTYLDVGAVALVVLAANGRRVPRRADLSRATARHDRYRSTRHGRRISGHSGGSASGSAAGSMIPAAMSSSYRLRRARVPVAGGTSSATTRSCAVTAMRLPASIWRT